MRKVADWKVFKMKNSLADMSVTYTIMLPEIRLIIIAGAHHEVVE